MQNFSISPEEIRAKQQAAIADRPAVEAQLKAAQLAAQEPTYSGWLRRQIHAHPEIDFNRLQEAAGLNQTQLLDFVEGVSTITSGQADAICKTLGIVPAGAEKVARF